jgi:type II secretory pathway pseudopilin PulG
VFSTGTKWRRGLMLPTLAEAQQAAARESNARADVMYARQFQIALRSIGLSLTADEVSAICSAGTGGMQSGLRSTEAIDAVSFVEQVRIARRHQVSGFSEEDLLRRRQADQDTEVRSLRSPARRGWTSPPPPSGHSPSGSAPRSPSPPGSRQRKVGVPCSPGRTSPVRSLHSTLSPPT